MDYERTIALIDEVVDLGVFDISLAGGEPLLHDRILDIIAHCAKRNVQLGLLTNGVLLDKIFLKELSKITLGRRFILQVSLDSPDPCVNDATRGQGQKVIDNLRQLSDYDIETQVSCVLTSVNIQRAHTIIDAFYPMIKRFHFLTVQRTSLALKHKELLIDEDQAEGFWRRLEIHSHLFPSDLFLPSLRIMMRMKELSEKGVARNNPLKFASFDCPGCSAGITHINIAPDFEVLGCDIAKDYTKMGNVSKLAFKTVWASEQAEAVRSFPVPACYCIKDDQGNSLLNNIRPQYLERLQRSGHIA